MNENAFLPAPTSAIGYVRLGKDLPSDTEQMHAIQCLAKRENYVVLRYYLDAEDSREQFTRLWIDQAECYDAHVVIAASADVFGRFTIYEAEQYALTFATLEMHVEFANDDIITIGKRDVEIASTLFSTCVRRTFGRHGAAFSSDDRREVARHLRNLIHYIETH